MQKYFEFMQGMLMCCALLSFSQAFLFVFLIATDHWTDMFSNLSTAGPSSLAQQLMAVLELFTIWL